MEVPANQEAKRSFYHPKGTNIGGQTPQIRHLKRKNDSTASMGSIFCSISASSARHWSSSAIRVLSSSMSLISEWKVLVLLSKYSRSRFLTPEKTKKHMGTKHTWEGPNLRQLGRSLLPKAGSNHGRGRRSGNLGANQGTSRVNCRSFCRSRSKTRKLTAQPPVRNAFVP